MTNTKQRCFTLSCALVTATFSEFTLAKEWLFDVYLDQSKIGQHYFNLSDEGVLTSTAKFNVKVLFINAYKYDHQAVEWWRGDCLEKLEAQTLEDKMKTNVKAQLSEQHLLVDDGKKQQTLPHCSMTFAYWNPKITEQSNLLNPQNAEWLETKFTSLGTENITVKNEKISAERYKLEGRLAGKPKLNIELWYKGGSDWVALKSMTPEGYTIRYQLR
ncbi:DUF6134 family protein [Methylotenera sp.]|uniref:DUF6134 family protein n=1 Tax=Methylotenera sp. TaxID=2051956 RepID=UPI0025E366A2|nr:DUF6134 family protein [Methylotenera sp.]